MSPYEVRYGKQPKLSHLRVWGYIAYYRISEPKRTKLGPKALKSIFLGYAVNSNAYRFWDVDSNVIIESTHAEFFETKFNGDITCEHAENTTMHHLIISRMHVLL